MEKGCVYLSKIKKNKSSLSAKATILVAVFNIAGMSLYNPELKHEASQVLSSGKHIESVLFTIFVFHLMLLIFELPGSRVGGR